MENQMNEFFSIVKNMRIAQREYFKRSATAKKTKKPEDFDSAKRVLQLSKELESQCDEYLKKLNV